MKASYSRFGCFSFCPKKYEHRYVLETPAPPKPELAFGVALHEALEENFRRKLDTRTDLPAGEAARVFRRVFDERIAGVAEESLRGPNDPQYLRALGEHFLARFLAERAPALQPAPRGVEASFRLPLPGGHELTGQFDLLDTDWVLHDFKTAARPYDPRRADRTQLVIYAWACERMFGRPPARLCFDVFVKGDGADGEAGLQAPVYFPAPASAELGRVADQLAALVDRLVASEAKADFPRAFEPLRCSWCEFQTPCLRDWELEGRPPPARIRLEKISYA